MKNTMKAKKSARRIDHQIRQVLKKHLYDIQPPQSVWERIQEQVGGTVPSARAGHP